MRQWRPDVKIHCLGCSSQRHKWSCLGLWQEVIKNSKAQNAVCVSSVGSGQMNAITVSLMCEKVLKGHYGQVIMSLFPQPRCFPPGPKSENYCVAELRVLYTIIWKSYTTHSSTHYCTVLPLFVSGVVYWLGSLVSVSLHLKRKSVEYTPFNGLLHLPVSHWCLRVHQGYSHLALVSCAAGVTRVWKLLCFFLGG